MATVRKRGRKWHFEIRMKGVYEGRSFYIKAEGAEWARQREVEISTGKKVSKSKATLGEAFIRYARDVSPTHKGARWEKIRLTKLGRDPLAAVRMRDIEAEHLAEFRDRRLREVASSSVNRELNLIASVLSTARREWGMIDHNPMDELSRPRNPQHRVRRISEDEIERLCWALGFEEGAQVTTGQQETAVAFLLALETTMRQGEITGLMRSDVFLQEQYVVVHDSKNGHRKTVALSARAVDLVKLLPEKGPRLFHVQAGTVSTLFRRARITAQIEDLTFHDSRHESATRLARKLDVLDLAAQMGVRDLKTLRIYYNPTPTEIAKRLG